MVASWLFLMDTQMFKASRYDSRLASTGRYEIKFNSAEASFQSVLHQLRMDPAIFRRTYPQRVIQSLYFDNHDLEAFEENVSGVSSRAKLRLRWYSSTFDVNQATLEFKVRRNRLGWKSQSNVSFAKPLGQLGFEDLLGEVHAQITPSLSQVLSLSPCPIQINKYTRDYFETSDGKVRATIDTGLEFFDQRFSRGPSAARKVAGPGILVLEFKAASSHFDELQRVVSRVPWPRSRNSKYVIGLSAALGF